MSEFMESTGKTVDEAIREALLRMGLRREEVDITVIQEARGGFLGMGRREAVVKVAKKQSRRRSGRGRQDEPGREEARSGRNQRGGERRSRQRDDEGSSRRRSRRRPETEKTDNSEVKAKEKSPERTPQNEQKDSSDESQRRSRRRRPRRRRKPAAEVEAAVANPVGDGKVFAEENQPEVKAEQTEQVKTPADEPVSEPVAEAAPAVEIDIPAIEIPDRTAPEPEAERPSRSEEETPAEAPAAARVENTGGILAADVVARNRVEPFTAADAEPLADFLQKVATSLMVKSGFPCRVQVNEGEYHLVKLVVDDRSAGVLIGRHGATVDAIEHLVEKMASQTAGDRVRMNLDINNYRLRREDQLTERARNAAAEARNTGEMVHLEPACARERRVVHLYIEDVEEDLTTYTESDGDGKHVVVCRPEQVPTATEAPDAPADAPVAEAAGESTEQPDPEERSLAAEAESGEVEEQPRG